MNSGRSFPMAIENAKANAQFFGRPYFVFAYLQNWHVERDRPKVYPYSEVTPDGARVEHLSEETSYTV